MAFAKPLHTPGVKLSGSVAMASYSPLLNRIRISRASSVPIHYQIKEQIRDAITSGVLVEGDPLPSERELVDRLNVSRMTIRRALSELIISGQLQTRPGKGTYVQAVKVEQALDGLAGFTADMARSGHHVSSRVLRSEIEPAQGRLVDLLRVKSGERLIALERVRLVDDEPTSWDRLYLPERLCPGIASRFDFARESLYTVLRREYQIALRWAQQRLEAALANQEEQRLLGIPEGAPILLSERTTYTDGDVIIEYGKSSYRGDRYGYDVKLIGDQVNGLR